MKKRFQNTVYRGINTEIQGRKQRKSRMEGIYRI